MTHIGWNTINLPTANHATAEWGPLQLWGGGEDGLGLTGGFGYVWTLLFVTNCVFHQLATRDSPIVI